MYKMRSMGYRMEYFGKIIFIQGIIHPPNTKHPLYGPNGMWKLPTKPWFLRGCFSMNGGWEYDFWDDEIPNIWKLCSKPPTDDNYDNL